ncbi:MAG: ORF6N domain-containing protein, partial [Dehalococcoidia bacterium]
MIDVARRIRVVRGQRLLLDIDLAALYEIPTHRLNEAVKRNPGRFPEDFAFRISAEEHAALISQIAISKTGRGGRRRSPPQAFTEHGAIMAASVLQSPRAVEMSVYVVRAFVRLRAVLASNAELSRKLVALERSVATLDASTRRQFDEVYAAIRALMATPETRRRPIGFTA